ncbi:amidohydrolase [Nonomuraea pusilla]|uniref:Hippurate hydrolase n=1 Tax=Nonomuraea pusilla TaxID=46177 RepID=A0A1H7FNU6_9ACTN|nr:amidohydrolase [Nonomuraea pusilla]SEK26142.1 hippurate hydrolase [Nonomuraea pusilla]
MSARLSVDTVLAGLDGIRSDLEAFYRDLHAHPELGHQETRTAARAAERLRAYGYDVSDRIGGTGVVGVLSNGDGPCVLFRADMDALPIEERTGLPYASTAVDGDGRPVMHACGHDVHVTALLGAARLMAQARAAWKGTHIALFQPAEESGEGARAMIADGLADRIPKPDVCLAQHVLPYPAGQVLTRPGPALSATDNYRITVHGRSAHGSSPDRGVDPVVMASMLVVRLQTVVSREVSPLTPVVLTVGSIHSGANPNNIPETAEIQLNVRTYQEEVRQRVKDAIVRIAHAECAASGAPQPPDIDHFGTLPPTINDEETTRRVATSFSAFFGERARELGIQTASEDFSEIPKALGVPFTYWGFGGTDPALYARAAAKGTIATDVPTNHNAAFAPVVQPTLDTGVQAAVVSALAYLGNGAR